jgi:hypothetical protein
LPRRRYQEASGEEGCQEEGSQEASGEEGCQEEGSQEASKEGRRQEETGEKSGQKACGQEEVGSSEVHFSRDSSAKTSVRTRGLAVPGRRKSAELSAYEVLAGSLHPRWIPATEPRA